jgi:hypothetical protein
MTKQSRIVLGLFCLISLAAVTFAAVPGPGQPILPRLHNIKPVSSTIPSNGDVNPYGVAQVMRSVGNLQEGNILVSNFNNVGNLQGKGTTIVQISPDGSFSQFAQIEASELPGPCIGGVGLTTALVVLQSGWVIVGSLPTTNGMSATMKAGCLIVLNSTGHPVETFYGSLVNGPWDMAASENGDRVKLYYTNVLNGTVAASPNIVSGATIVRMDLHATDTEMPSIESMTVIGSGFEEQTSTSALVVGPTGVGLTSPCDQYDNCTSSDDDSHDVDLVVADTLLNRIQIIPHANHRQDSAGTGITLTSGGALNGPLGLVVAPDGQILTVNGGDGRIIDIAPNGVQLATKFLDTTGTPPGNGALFGLVFDPVNGIYFVDDNENQLNVLH